MKTAKIAELKANLSAYLAEVRNGETVVVCDRETPIARLVPFAEIDDLTVLSAVDSARAIRKVKAPKLLKAVDIDKCLAESRTDK